MSNNGMILHVTAAGRAQRTTARLNGDALPRFTGWIVDAAVEQNVDAPIVQPLYTSGSSAETLVERIDDSAIGIRIVIPPTFAGWVRGIAITTSDGVVYAYARFAPENGGLYKPMGTAIRALLILAEDGRESVEFTYSVVDVDALRTQLLDDLYESLVDRLRSTIANDIDICVIDGGDETGTPCDHTSGTLITLADRVDGGNL